MDSFPFWVCASGFSQSGGIGFSKDARQYQSLQWCTCIMQEQWKSNNTDNLDCPYLAVLQFLQYFENSLRTPTIVTLNPFSHLFRDICILLCFNKLDFWEVWKLFEAAACKISGWCGPYSLLVTPDPPWRKPPRKWSQPNAMLHSTNLHCILINAL